MEFKPVTAGNDASIVPWETWVYVNVGGGIEITFTDEFHNGTYNYAPAPRDARIPSRQQAMLTRYNPHNVYRMAAAATPEYYVPPQNEDPMEFYYESADFRKLPGLRYGARSLRRDSASPGSLPGRQRSHGDRNRTNGSPAQSDQRSGLPEPGTNTLCVQRAT